MEIKTDNFIGYEYKEIIIKKKYETLFIDSLENFGWIFESTKNSINSYGNLTLKFKRNRKIRNKAELTRLERQFEAIIEFIDHLETNKTLIGSIIAYILGVIGCAFMAGSVISISMFFNELYMVILSIPGFIFWIIPYFVFNKIKNKKTAEINPKIDEKYDELYEVLKRSNYLLEE